MFLEYLWHSKHLKVRSIDTGNPDTRIKLFSLEKYEIKPSKIVDNTSTNKKHRSNIRHAHKNLQANFSLNTNIPVSL